MHSLTYCLAIILLVYVSAFPAQSEYPCGYTPIKPELHQKIGYLKDAKSHSWPWMAVICRPTEAQKCFDTLFMQGTIVGSRWILTLGSFKNCSSGDNGNACEGAEVKLGVSSLMDPNASFIQTFGVERMFVYLDKDILDNNMLTLVKLNGTIEYSRFIQPICLAVPSLDPYKIVGSPMWTVGWTSEKEGFHNYLQQSQNFVNVYEDAPNKIIYTNYTLQGSIFLPGSPLLSQNVDKRWYQYGLLWFFSDQESMEKEETYENWFTRIGHYCSWISDTTGGEVQCDGNVKL
ncbi:trypsin domain-containing protein [Ditylenchus destructor]|nr:trypsin domain-containing protein [Ditylenchus destructor]